MAKPLNKKQKFETTLPTAQQKKNEKQKEICFFHFPYFLEGHRLQAAKEKK
jgi:hypothetical protein